MPSDNREQGWSLESFLDSLILELDKAQDTLSVKGINRKLTYTVKDLALDLQVFPSYSGKSVRFVNARPGDTGASRLNLQLGSISDRQIKETTKGPKTSDDIAIDDIEEIDDDIKDTLKKVGVQSANDLERMKQKNVDIETIVSEKAPSVKKIGYSDLANLINKARRRKLPPSVSQVSIEQSAGGEPELVLRGRNLALGASAHPFPEVAINRRRARIITARYDEMRISSPGKFLHEGVNSFAVALDPYAVMTFRVHVPAINKENYVRAVAADSTASPPP